MRFAKCVVVELPLIRDLIEMVMSYCYHVNSPNPKQWLKEVLESTEPAPLPELTPPPPTGVEYDPITGRIMRDPNNPNLA